MRRKTWLEPTNIAATPPQDDLRQLKLARAKIGELIARKRIAICVAHDVHYSNEMKFIIDGISRYPGKCAINFAL